MHAYNFYWWTIKVDHFFPTGPKVIDQNALNFGLGPNCHR